MNMGEPTTSNKPIGVIMDVDCLEGRMLKHGLRLDGRLRVRCLTKDYNMYLARRAYGLAPGVEFLYVDPDDAATIKPALADATFVIVSSNFEYFLKEHSTISLASVSKRPAAGIAKFREVARGKDITNALAQIPTLKTLCLIAVPEANGQAIDDETFMRLQAQTAIWENLVTTLPSLDVRALYLDQDSSEEDVLMIVEGAIASALGGEGAGVDEDKNRDYEEMEDEDEDVEKIGDEDKAAEETEEENEDEEKA